MKFTWTGTGCWSFITNRLALFWKRGLRRTIDYLNKIINWKVDLRTDLQCYSRLLHLIAHYELGNYQLLEYLIKSVYRFMAKMGNLSLVEEEIFNFLRKSFKLTPEQLKAGI